MKQKYFKKVIKLADSLIINTLFKLIYKLKYIFVLNFWNFKKKLGKFFNTIVQKPLSNLGNTIDDFFIKIFKKKLVKIFDNFVQKIIFKFNDLINRFFGKNSKVSNFNKSIITLISLLFFYLFYLSIPTLYNKTWVQNIIEEKLLEEFKINFSTSSEISYFILPAPHFLIENSKIIREIDNKPVSISEIKKLKVFIYQNNFFKKENIDLKKVHIDNANFSLKGKDLIYLNKATDNKFSKKEVKIKNSKIFFEDEEGTTITIIKLSKAIFFYNELKVLNIFNLKGEIFKTPFLFELNKHFDRSDKKITKIEAKKLKLDNLNEYTKTPNKFIKGSNTISVLNFKTQTEFNLKKDLISFESDDTRVKNPNFNYKGKLYIKPFNLELNINLEKFELSKLLDIESIFGEFIKSRLLFNENISVNTKVNINSNKNSEIFNSSLVNFNINNGKINFDKSKFTNKNIGHLEIHNSDLHYTKDGLILVTDFIIDIKNSDNLYSLLQTPKKSRKLMKNVIINLNYNFLSKQIDVNKIKINGADSNNEAIKVFEDFNNMTDFNLHKARRILNKFFSAYSG